MQLEDLPPERFGDVILGMDSFLRITLSEIERAYADAHDALLQRHEANARLFAVAVESCDAAILTASLDGTITAHNSAAELLLGYQAGEALGRALSELTREDLRAALGARLAEAARGVPTRGFETIWRNKLGRELCMSLTVSPVKVSDGRAVGLSIVAHDISKQKQTQ
jgi:PAS domain S-box-containing protein